MTSCSHSIVDLRDYVFFQEGPGLRKWQWTEAGMKVINVTNILASGSVDISNTSRFISLDEFKEKYSHFAIDAGDVVVASSGNTYGKVGRVKGCHLPIMMNTSVIRFRPINPEKLHPDYLYAFLRSDFFRAQIERFVVGSAQPNFGPTHVKLMQLIMPEWEHQRRIASIVSAYDDLIENNTRRIEILEEMARRLYEEWFVQFRFPGHEGMEFEHSALGLIPAGWAVGCLKDVITLQRGFDLPAQHRVAGAIPIISATGVGGSHAEAKVKGPGVITGRSGSIGTVMYTHGDFWPLNTTLWGAAYPLGSTLFAYYVLSSIDLKGFNVGAAVPSLNRNDIHGLSVTIPPSGIVRSFEKVIGPVHDLAENVRRKNANLRAQRDLLLPKLISGEIDVSDFPMPT